MGFSINIFFIFSNSLKESIKTQFDFVLKHCCESLFRSKIVNEWFPNYVKVQSLFLSIKDFESDCRNFLNHFNEGLGDQQLVHSLGMLSCEVEEKVLMKPGGINEFWVDFNKRAKTISFYYVNNPSEVSFLINCLLKILT